MNIIDYVKENTYTFQEHPFNAVDSLVLSQLSYARLEFALPEEKGIRSFFYKGHTLGEFFRNEYFQKIFFDGISDGENMELMAYMTASRRFRDLRILDIVGDFDKSCEKQFGAMIFELDKDTDFVAFRGTDGSMMGWKEDFNLSFMNEVPSQQEAVQYLERNYGSANRRGRNRKLYTGGHSKGGNLAVYSALRCSPEVQARLLGAYSLDGPGFRDEVQVLLDEAAAKSGIPIIKLVPGSSVVGMLMQNNDNYQVIQSDGTGIMQHIAYSWQVEEGDFIYLEEIDGSGKFMNRTVHDWLLTVDDEKRRIFINTIFEVLEENGVETLQDLKTKSFTELAKMIASLRSLDEEERAVVGGVLKSLAVSAVPKFRRRKRDSDADNVESGDESRENTSDELR